MDLIAIPDFAAGKIGKDSCTKERFQIGADGVLKTGLLCEQVRDTISTRGLPEYICISKQPCKAVYDNHFN